MGATRGAHLFVEIGCSGEVAHRRVDAAAKILQNHGWEWVAAKPSGCRCCSGRWSCRRQLSSWRLNLESESRLGGAKTAAPQAVCPKVGGPVAKLGAARLCQLTTGDAGQPLTTSASLLCSFQVSLSRISREEFENFINFRLISYRRPISMNVAGPSFAEENRPALRPAPPSLGQALVTATFTRLASGISTLKFDGDLSIQRHGGAVPRTGQRRWRVRCPTPFPTPFGAASSSRPRPQQPSHPKQATATDMFRAGQSSACLSQNISVTNISH